LKTMHGTVTNTPAILEERRCIHILHLEDSAVDHQLVRRALTQAGMVFVLAQVETLPAFAQAVQSNAVDVILADYSLAGFTAMDAWASLARNPHQPPFILVSGAIGEAAAVEAIQQGMSDYLPKDNLAKLPRVIARALEVHEARRARGQAHVELAASEQRLAVFAAHLQDTIEEERASIAREIHDDIGGSLAAIQFDLAWIGRHSADTATLQHVGNATDMLRHAMGASQRIMVNLRPAVLDQGLASALQWLSESFEKRHGIVTRCDAAPLRTVLSSAVELAAYRTAQEALTNIAKYAQCTSVKLELSDAGGTLTLEITDNGCGIAPERRANPRGYGLKGLRERARTVGGWLDVSSRAGGGTSITLSIPLEETTAPASEGLS
jgi:signal transduction histidine kinase